MSIEKFNPKVTHEAIPYLQVNQSVVQQIDNLEAGFVWIYLLSKPENWEVIKSHLKNHFKIGDDKIKSIFAYLHKCKLIEYIRERDEKGIFRKTEIRVLNGSQFVNYQQHTEQQPTGVKIQRVASHTCGKPATTNKRDLQIKEKTKIREASRKKRAPLSLNFKSNEKAKAVCQGRGLNVLEMEAKFVAAAHAQGKLFVDEQAAFELFVRNERVVLAFNPVNQTTKPILSPTTKREDYVCSGCKRPGAYCTCKLAARETNLKAVAQIKAMLARGA